MLTYLFYFLGQENFAYTNEDDKAKKSKRKSKKIDETALNDK